MNTIQSTPTVTAPRAIFSRAVDTRPSEARPSLDLGRGVQMQTAYLLTAAPDVPVAAPVPPPAPPAPPSAVDVLARWTRRPEEAKSHLEQLARFGQGEGKLDAKQTRDLLDTLRALANLRGQGEFTLPEGMKQPGFLEYFLRSVPADMRKEALTSLLVSGALVPEMKQSLGILLERHYGQDLGLKDVIEMNLPASMFKTLANSTDPETRRRFIDDQRLAFDQSLGRMSPKDSRGRFTLTMAALQLTEFPERFAAESIDWYRKQLQTTDPVSRSALMRLLARLAVVHPKPEVREKATVGFVEAFPPEQRPAVLQALGAERAAIVQKAAIEEGGELGKSVAASLPTGPLKQEHVTRLTQGIQRRFQDLLVNCEDDAKLRKAIEGIADVDIRNRLLKDFAQTQRDLTVLKRLMGARGLAHNNYWQYKNSKTIDGAACDRQIARCMNMPIMKDLMTGLHKTAVAHDCPQGPELARQQAEYLKSQTFRDKMRMLATPGQTGLNPAQRQLLMENVARAAAFETDSGKQDQLMASVAESLAQDPKLGMQLKQEEGERFQAQLLELAKDGSLSPQEREVVDQLLKAAKEGKELGKGGYEIYKSIKGGEKKLLTAAAEAGNVGKFAKTLSVLKQGAHYLGPVGELYGAVQNYEELRSAIKEGDTAGATLKFGALCAGGAGAAIGLGAICLGSGPPGWIVGGLAVAASLLGIAGDLVSEDPFIRTCKDYGVMTEGEPKVLPGYFEGWDYEGRIISTKGSGLANIDPSKKRKRW